VSLNEFIVVAGVAWVGGSTVVGYCLAKSAARREAREQALLREYLQHQSRPRAMAAAPAPEPATLRQ
jgi:hypothetical protein